MCSPPAFTTATTALSNTRAVTDPLTVTLRTANVSETRLRSVDVTEAFDVDDLIPATTNTNFPDVPELDVGELNSPLVDQPLSRAHQTQSPFTPGVKPPHLVCFVSLTTSTVRNTCFYL